MKLSDRAWKQSEDIFNDFLSTPFFQEMNNGTLGEVTYANFLEQDYIFVVIESKFEAMIASVIDTEYREFFLEYSITASAYAEEVELFLQENKNFTRTGIITPATKKYTCST